MKVLHRTMFILAAVVFFAGCQNTSQLPEDNWLLVSFEEDVPLTYKMVSKRATEIDLTTSNPSKKSRPQTMTEKLELVMVYTPVEVDLFGLSTIKVECQSAKVTRSAFSGKTNSQDAVESLVGKSFTLKISPTGRIEDASDLQRVAEELGAKAFSEGRSNMRIKNPDMIADFLAMQQLLWDASATIANQLDLEVGDQWQAQQTIAWPTPMYPPPARATTYTLDQIQDDLNNPADLRKAIITSTYTLSETPMETYIRPYETGKFQTRGMFGFLRNYQFKHLEGRGTQVFNMEDGLVESDQQEYLLNVDASFMLPLGDSQPVLTVNQTFSIERIQAD